MNVLARAGVLVFSSSTQVLQNPGAFFLAHANKKLQRIRVCNITYKQNNFITDLVNCLDLNIAQVQKKFARFFP